MGGVTIAVSGGFDPLHIGHLRMMQSAAKKYGAVVVILNSDAWLRRKKGFALMQWFCRAEIIRELRCVDKVVMVDDSDGTVCSTLRILRPTYFGNAGDRNWQNTPELPLCHEIGIKPVFDLETVDTESSSTMVRRAAALLREVQ